MDHLIEQLVLNIKSKKADSLTSVMVLQEAVHLARDEPIPKKVVEETLRRIAAGVDGVSNTKDDVLSGKIVDDLVALLNTGLVGELFDAFVTYERRAKWCCWKE